MFDRVPAHVWILIGIAAVAYAPAQYVYRYIACSPSRRDITQPAGDLSWRTTGQLVRSLGVLAAFVGLAIFVFTPAAEQVARSPAFWPVLILCVGAWALFTVAQGFVTGRIQPFIKGINDTYAREMQPKRFWASLAWNAALGCLCIWLAYQMNTQAFADALWDECYGEGTAYSAQDSISACNELIRDPDSSKADVAYAITARGFAYYRLGNYQQAVSDYNEAIRLQPDDPVAHLDRGLLFLDTGRFNEAVVDFTRAHELDPKDPWALANRGITYAWKNDLTRAAEDFNAVRAIDPSNPVLLRGAALLSMKAGDMRGAVERLTAALTRDPDNAWSFRMRAEAYRQLGEHEKARADTNRLLQLSNEMNGARPKAVTSDQSPQSR